MGEFGVLKPGGKLPHSARNIPSSLQTTLPKRSLEQTFAMVTVALEKDFAREARPKQSVLTLPLLLSTK
ncbi:MAG: hypothetical protein B6I19_08325 [Bacteroidetes bacterium 4572_114]|nr:MAG: hypothetical protein B6I19_08325 [Bacteroidetes bacterium 4572_114]